MKRISLFLLLFFLVILAKAADPDSSLYHYIWLCNGQLRECTLQIDDQLLEYYRNERDHIAYRYSGFGTDQPQSPANYSGFMFSEYGHEVIRDLTDQLVDDTMTLTEKIISALTFVQSMPYAMDSMTKDKEEYVRYPVELLADRMGDCEDKAMLLGAVLQEMGVRFVLLEFPDHLAIGVQRDGVDAESNITVGGEEYCFVETTAPNWKIGQVPEEYLRSSLEVYIPQTTPVLIVKGMWFETTPATIFEKATCTLKLRLFNSGPHEITGLQLDLQMVVQKLLGGDTITSESFSLEDLQEGEDRMSEISFKSLISEDIVLQMRLVGNDIPDQALELRMDP